MKIRLPFFISTVAFLTVGVIFSRAEGIWTQVNIPVKDTLLAVDFVAPDDGWAVGLHSSILHWDGNEWEVYPSPVQPSYTAIQMLDPNNGWAVGYGGVIIHWDGEQWNQVISPTDYSLYDISFLSPNVGWAVGGNFTVTDPRDPSTMKVDKIILNWDGVSWNIVPTPKEFPLNLELLSIGMVSENEGWVAGKGEILRWNGEEWSRYIPTVPNLEYIDIEDIQVVDAQNVWFVGHKTATGHILHWDGTELKEVFKTNLGLYAIDMISPNFGWAVGGNNITSEGGSLLLQWDGVEWKEVQSPTTLPLQFVWADSESNGWLLAGGNNPNAGYEGAMFRFVSKSVPSENPTLTSTSTPLNEITPTLIPTFVPTEIQENRGTEVFETLIPTSIVTTNANNGSIYGISGLVVGAVCILLAILLVVFGINKGRGEQ